MGGNINFNYTNYGKYCGRIYSETYLCIPTVAHSVYITHEISVHHCLLESSTTHGVRIILLLVVGKVSNVQAIENADSMSFKVTS